MTAEFFFFFSASEAKLRANVTPKTTNNALLTSSGKNMKSLLAIKKIGTTKI